MEDKRLFNRLIFLLLFLAVPFVSVVAQDDAEGEEEAPKAVEDRVGEIENLFEKLSLNGVFYLNAVYEQWDLPDGDTGGAARCPIDLTLKGLIDAGAVPGITSTSLPNYGVTTPCKAEDDAYAIRSRLTAKYDATDFAQIVWAGEIGWSTAGSDPSDTHSGKDSTGGALVMDEKERSHGNGSGGKHYGSSGATNIETRNIYVKLHDSEDAMSLKVGRYHWALPNDFNWLGGIGFGFDYSVMEDLDLSLNAIRMEDNTDDADSNGFDDTNKNDKWQMGLQADYGVSESIDTTFWHLYQADHSTRHNFSDLSWTGLDMDFDFDPITIGLGVILNTGTFHQNYGNQLGDSSLTNKFLNKMARDNFGATSWKSMFDAYNTLQETAGDHGQQFKVDANRIDFDFGYSLGEDMDVSLQYSRTSGRSEDDVDSDGGSVAYRSDQFQYPGGSIWYEHQSYVMYWWLMGGDGLDGINSQAAHFSYTMGDWSFDLGYAMHNLNTAPNMQNNKRYIGMGPYEMNNIIGYMLDNNVTTLNQTVMDAMVASWVGTGSSSAGWNFGNSSSTNLGTEVDLNVVWEVDEGLDLDVTFGYFMAGNGYLALRDVEFGKVYSLVDVYLIQSF